MASLMSGALSGIAGRLDSAGTFFLFNFIEIQLTNIIV